MKRQEVQHHFRRKNIKHHQFSQRIIAKPPMNLRQRKLALHNSHRLDVQSHQKNQQLISQQNNENQFLPPTQPIILSQNQIKSSSAYKKLQQQLNSLTENHVNQIQQLNEMKINKGQQIQQVKKQLYQIRLDIWHLRDQRMELTETLEQEHQTYQRLLLLMQAEDQHFQNLNQYYLTQLQQSNPEQLPQSNLEHDQQNIEQIHQQNVDQIDQQNNQIRQQQQSSEDVSD